MSSGAPISAGRSKKDGAERGGRWWLWEWLCSDVLRAADRA